jgi:hypothetical protein
MILYRKHHPYDWMKGYLLKPETVEIVLGFFIFLIGLLLFSYIVSFVFFFVLKAMGIIEAGFFQFFGGQGVIP